MERALDLAKLIGMTDLAPAKEIFVDAVQARADEGMSRSPRMQRARGAERDRAA